MKKCIVLLLAISVLMISCVDLRSCSGDLLGKYVCTNYYSDENYLELRKDGSYYHYYRFDEEELINEGTWKIDNCDLILRGWKNFNQKASVFDLFGSVEYSIVGDCILTSPDETCTSEDTFRKVD